MLNTCLSIHHVQSNGSPIDASNQHQQRNDMYPGMQFGTGAMLPQSPCVPDTQLMASPGISQTYEHSHVGGGFKNSLIGQGRRTLTCNNIPIGSRRAPMPQNKDLPTLHGTKLGPNMGGLPPPPPYPQEPSPQEASVQWQQSPAQPVPTPSPQDAAALPLDTTSLQVPLSTSMSTVVSQGNVNAYDNSQQQQQQQNSPGYMANGSMASTADLYNPNPLQTQPQHHLQVPTTHRQRHHHHNNYVPQAGNVPLVNDYTHMPCNLQERMTAAAAGQQNSHAFHMHNMTSLEETLNNLPYDAIQLPRALPNHSGSV